MARQRGAAGRALTPDRAARLARLVNLLSGVARTREDAAAALELDLRSFYRDLEVLRALGVVVDLRSGLYRLRGSVDAALSRLPFPDPQLTIGEAVRLAQAGDTPAHRRLRGRIREVTGRPVPTPRQRPAPRPPEPPSAD
jgi:predicted DNA-binding transcriptional regulator YafY